MGLHPGGPNLSLSQRPIDRQGLSRSAPLPQLLVEGSLNLVLRPGYGANPLGDVDERANLRKDFDAYAYNPSQNFGFLDVSEASIGTGAFGIGYGDWKRGPFYWAHQPAERHDRGANLSFLDGHVEPHRWRFTPKHFVPSDNDLPPVGAPQNDEDREDLLWLHYRCHFGQFRKAILGLL